MNMLEEMSEKNPIYSLIKSISNQVYELNDKFKHLEGEFA